MPFKSNKQKQWMEKNLPKIHDSWDKKYNKGGKLEGHLKGPSHEDGGIQAIVDGVEPIEVEGGEFVINKPTVDAL